jgi:hypothetical protein
MLTNTELVHFRTSNITKYYRNSFDILEIKYVDMRSISVPLMPYLQTWH